MDYLSKKRRILPLAVAWGTLYLLGGASSVSAQSGTATALALEEVVVTARRREENLQEVPVAVTSLSQGALDRYGTFDVQDLAQSVPGLRVSGQVGNRHTVIFNIRGQDITYGALFPAVVPYFAEVPITGGPSAPGISQGVFYDLQTVQVLRGPQGTLFGRVTDGGNVMINPQLPTDTLGGNLEVQLGDYDLQVYSGMLNVPITDEFAVRVAFQSKDREGFTENELNGQKLDDSKYNSVRVSLLWKPTDRFVNSTIFNYYNADGEGTGVTFGDYNPLAVAATLQSVGMGPVSSLIIDGLPPNGYNPIDGSAAWGGLPDFDGWSFASALAAQKARGNDKTLFGDKAYYKRTDKYFVNTTAFDITDDITLKNILGYTEIEEDSGGDYDGSPLAYIDTYHNFLPFVTQKQWSNELQLQGTSFDDKLDWIVGTYFDEQKPDGENENYTINLFIVQRNGIQYTKTTSEAYYGQVSYELGDYVKGLSTDLGVRYTKDTVKSDNVTILEFIGIPIPHGKCVDYTSVAGFGTATCEHYEADFNETTYTAALNYQINDFAMTYLSVRTGYRPGGFNATSAGNSNASFEPETNTSTELGLKAEWSLGNMPVRTNIAVFYDDYQNIQKLITETDPSNGTPTSIVTNAADGKIYGVEFEGTIVPLDGLTIGLDFAYTDASYDSGNPLACPADPATQAQPADTGFCSKNKFARTPEWQGNLNIRYTMPVGSGELSFGGNLYYQDEMWLNDSSYFALRPPEDNHTIVNLDVRLTEVAGQPLDLFAFVTNVTDEEYRVSENNLNNFGNPGFASDVWGAPRMWGVGLKYHFGED